MGWLSRVEPTGFCDSTSKRGGQESESPTGEFGNPEQLNSQHHRLRHCVLRHDPGDLFRVRNRQRHPARHESSARKDDGNDHRVPRQRRQLSYKQVLPPQKDEAPRPQLSSFPATRPHFQSARIPQVCLQSPARDLCRPSGGALKSDRRNRFEFASSLDHLS